MISYSLYVFLCTNLFIMLDSVLKKASMGVDPHFIDVWVPMHRDPETTQKLVSNNSNSYICMHCLFYSY
jgi:hypothetical protein